MSEDDSARHGLLDAISDEMLGQLIKQVLSNRDGNILDLQNQARIVARRFFTRNAIFTAKVQDRERVNIPQSEVEKLDLEQGDLVQVVLTPVDRKVVDQEESQSGD